MPDVQDLAAKVEKVLNRYLRVRTLRSRDNWRDPLYRKPGDSLDPLRFTKDQLEKKRDASGPREWGSLWQQDPRAYGGGQFDRLLFTDPDPRKNRVLDPEIFDHRTKGLEWCRGYDFAYTAKQWNKPDPDFTCGVKTAFDIDWDTGIFNIYVADMILWRSNWGESKTRILAQALTDGTETWIGGEDNGPQKAALDDLLTMPGLANFVVVGAPAAADKSARAQRWLSRAQVGLMWLRKGAWNEWFFDAGEAYPNGPHDDPIDGVSVSYDTCVIRAMAPGDVDEGEETEVPSFNERW